MRSRSPKMNLSSDIRTTLSWVARNDSQTTRIPTGRFYFWKVRLHDRKTAIGSSIATLAIATPAPHALLKSCDPLQPQDANLTQGLRPSRWSTQSPHSIV